MALAYQEKHKQLNERKYLKARDQHGRVWGANIHMQTQHPVDPITPFQWTAPYLPAPQYVHWRYDNENGGHSIFIDYDADIRDRRAALKTWTEELMRTGLQLNGQAFDARRPSPEVLFRVGPRPVPAEIPQAAQAGEPWVLGKPVAKPRWAQAFFPETAPDPLAFLNMAEDEGDDDEGETEVAVPQRVTKAAPRKRKRARARARSSVTKAAPSIAAVAAVTPE